MSNARTAEIRKIAKDLLEEGKVELFIGFQEGTVPLRSRPAFVQAEAADSLVWDSFCANNLAVYLPKYYENQPGRRKKREKPYPKIGVAAKGCDMRSIVALTKERQVQRDSLLVVGVPCEGMIDTRKVEAAVAAKGGDGGAAAADEILEARETEAGKLEVTTRSFGVLSFDREEVLQDCCLECRFPMPEGADILLSGQARKPGDGGYARIEQFMKKSSEERWDYFSTELSRCIRCNACRQACPTCWCKECFAEQTDLKWIGVGNTPSDAMIFQIIRVFHQAGRCVECDACYRACPMHIDLRLYTKKIVKDVEDIFGYLPAFDAEALPPLATFGDEQCDFFITDPDKAETTEGTGQ
jgi:formate dehydrogenase subunit beta